MNNDKFEDWYNTEGIRFWTPSGHQEYLKFAFNAGMEVFRADLIKANYENDLWARGAKIYDGHEEALANWKMVSDKLLKAMESNDERQVWEAKELYDWAKSRDIELKEETNDL